MPQFIVPVVPRDMLPLWQERWQNKPTKRALKADNDGSLSQNVMVTAKNTTEAALIAESERPGCTAISESIIRIG